MTAIALIVCFVSYFDLSTVRIHAPVQYSCKKFKKVKNHFFVATNCNTKKAFQECSLDMKKFQFLITARIQRKKVTEVV